MKGSPRSESQPDPHESIPRGRPLKLTPSGASRRTIAWLTSLLVHAGLALLVLATFRRIVRELPPDPDRLVFVEPAPPPPPLVVASVDTLEQPVEAPKPEPARLIDAPTKAKPPVSRKPTPKPTPMEPAAADASKSTVPEARSAEVGGVDGGTAGGTAGGKLGGVIGGKGDDLVRAELAASPPVVISRVLPEYPPQARSRHLEGQVLLQAIVDRNGHVEDRITVVRSLPPFDAAAVAALRQWRFTPGRDRDGRAVRVQIEVPMRFQLR